MMVELGYCSGIENYSRHCPAGRAGRGPPTLFDYLPDDAAGRRRVARDDPAARRRCTGRPLAQGDPGRIRFPPAVGADNRPLRSRNSRRRAPQTIYVSRDAARLRARALRRDRRAGGAPDRAWSTRRSRCARRRRQVDDLLSEIQQRTRDGDRVLVTTLTKRMAEDLTDYLLEHGVRVRYLHSDIDTVERVEIIRDLRLGEFDVLVGINLLREGLDMPRCRWSRS